MGVGRPRSGEVRGPRWFEVLFLLCFFVFGVETHDFVYTVSLAVLSSLPAGFSFVSSIETSRNIFICTYEVCLFVVRAWAPLGP